MSEYTHNAVTIWTKFNEPRELLDWHELTDRERDEFDYIDDPDADGIARFVRYKGIVYDLHEFQTTDDLPKDNPLRQWDGYQLDSFYSGIAVRFDPQEPADRVIMATFCV